MHWIPITDENQIEEIIAASRHNICLIYKHSSSCSISDISKWRLENGWIFQSNEVTPYFLDIIIYRKISQKLAAVFNVYHESPQVLLISNGECIYDNSHLDINIADIELCYKEMTIS